MLLGCHEFRSLNRRQMLRIGGYGLFGLTLSGILRGQAQAETKGLTPQGEASDRHLARRRTAPSRHGRHEA
jgi:hypothetical protein